MLPFLVRNFSTETIFALATARGKAGVGVIRISGAQCRDVLSRLVNPQVHSQLVTQPRKLFNCKLYDEEMVLDNAMAVFFQGPRSFTGEDVAELHVHSSTAIIAAIYRKLSNSPGVRIAEAGEFSRNAFINGKLDLTQVEGLADLMAAETEGQRKFALLQFDGSMSKAFRVWREKIIRSMAMVEAWIDFSEDELIENDTLDKVEIVVMELVSEIICELEKGKMSEIIKNGYKIALCGPPNAGKSSLLNALLQRDAAIVSPIAGTTRDILQVSLELSGQSILLLDTAGIRERSQMCLADSIEAEGIKRALKAADNADRIFYIIDGNAAHDKDSWLPQLLELDYSKVDIILNKSDMEMSIEKEAFQSLLPPVLKGVNIIQTSCKQNTGYLLDKIRKLMMERITDFSAESALPIIANERHRAEANAALKSLEEYLSCNKADAVLGAECLRNAATHVGRITGDIDSEDVLDILFSTFCIGK